MSRCFFLPSIHPSPPPCHQCAAGSQPLTTMSSVVHGRGVIAHITRGTAPSTAAGITCAAPFVLDVICGQDKGAVEKYIAAATSAVLALVTSGDPDVVARAAKALREAPCKQVPMTIEAAAALEAALDKLAQAADDFSAAVARKTMLTFACDALPEVLNAWDAMHEVLNTVSVLTAYGTAPAPLTLVQAGVNAIGARMRQGGLKYGDKNALWKHAATLAKLDTGDACTAGLCRIWTVVVGWLGGVLDEPNSDDMLALGDLSNALLPRCETNADKYAASLRTLIAAGGLSAADQLLHAHGYACEEYAGVLTTLWKMASQVDDACFTAIATRSEGYLQKLQEVSGWQGTLLRKTYERIRALGLVQMVPAKELAEAVSRAEKAEAEVKHLADTGILVRSTLQQLLQPADAKVAADSASADSASVGQHDAGKAF